MRFSRQVALTIPKTSFPIFFFTNLGGWLFFFFFSVWPFFYSIFFITFTFHFLPTYFSNHSPFLREQIFCRFNKFPSLVCWYTVIHHHRQQGPTLFHRVRCDFMCVQCNFCSYFKCHLKIQGNVNLIPCQQGLLQNK